MKKLFEALFEIIISLFIFITTSLEGAMELTKAYKKKKVRNEKTIKK